MENREQEVIRPDIPVCPVLRKARRGEEEEGEEEAISTFFTDRSIFIS